MPDQVSFIWLANGLPRETLSHLKLSDCPDTAINSSFKLGSAAQVSKHIQTRDAFMSKLSRDIYRPFRPSSCLYPFFEDRKYARRQC